MKVIVSDVLEDHFDDFMVVDDCVRVNSIENVDTLIIHTTGEYSGWDFGLFFPGWINDKGIKTFVYINEEPDISIQMLVNSVNGKDEGLLGACFKDTFYLDDEEDLNALLEQIKTDGVVTETTAIVEASGSIIKDFCARLAVGDTTVNNKGYLTQVNDAVNQLIEVNELQSTMIQDMNESAMEVFERTTAVLTDMENERKNLVEKLRKLEEDMDNTTSTSVSFNSLITNFPPYRYNGVSQVLYIKEYGPCRYLNSFVRAYTHYLHYALNKKVKLVFVSPRGAILSKRYDDTTSIDQGSEGYESLYDAEIIVTNNPTKPMLKKLFSKNSDIYIFVDRLTQDSPLIQGRVKPLFAISGLSDVKRFDAISLSDCIVSMDEVRDGKEEPYMVLTRIKKYAEMRSEDTRLQAYMQLYKDRFLQLDDYLGVVK